jgi:hypothetical protein
MVLGVKAWVDQDLVEVGVGCLEADGGEVERLSTD